jgi:hypothetical protein
LNQRPNALIATADPFLNLQIRKIIDFLESNRKHFQQCTWPASIRESSSPAVAPLKTVPIGARLKQMWR